ncbi:MAG: hypothetical protein IIB03_02970, partial [Acidobacteria bacterium]|nr:hypothetical protein [Acidobacteriota bacterium]
DQSKRQELAENINDKSLSREKCLALLRQTTSSLHRLRVGTLDSFFAKIAGSYSLEIGLPMHWKITDEQTDGALRDEAIQAVLNKDSIRDLLTLMHLLTKGEATRGVSDLVRETVKQLYTLFRETKVEAWKKIPYPKPPRPDELEALLEDLRTVELPSDKRFAKARDKDYQKALASDWAEFVKSGLATRILHGDELYYKKEIPPPVVELYTKLLKHAKYVLVGLLVQQTEATFHLLEKFDAQYQRLKIERRNLRFDDITQSLQKRNLFLTIQKQLNEWEVERKVLGEVASVSVRSIGPGRSLLEVLLDTEGGSLAAIWFNQPFLEKIQALHWEGGVHPPQDSAQHQHGQHHDNRNHPKLVPRVL